MYGWIDLYSYVNDMISYTENPNESVINLFKLVNKFNMFAGDEINVFNRLYLYMLAMSNLKMNLRKPLYLK